MISTLKRVIPGVFIFLLFGGWSTFQLVNKGYLENGFEFGWIGFTDLKLDNRNAIIMFLVLMIQVLYVIRAFVILSKAKIKTSIFLETIVIIKIIYGLIYSSGFIFNLLQLLAFIGFGSALQTTKTSRATSKRFIFSIIVIIMFFIDLAILSINSGGRGHLFIPLIILVASFRFKGGNFKALLLMVIFSVLLVKATFLKFGLEGDEWRVALNFLLGRINQMDSVYWVLQHPNSWHLAEYGLPLRVFEAMDYLNWINEIEIEKWLYSRIFAGDGGFAVHPFSEFIWTTKSVYLSFIFMLLLFEYTLGTIRILIKHFKIVAFIGWYLLVFILLKPESLVIIGMYLFKYVPLLIVFNLVYESTKTNICQTPADKQIQWL